VGKAGQYVGKAGQYVGKAGQYVGKAGQYRGTARNEREGSGAACGKEQGGRWGKADESPW
jgi:hypothetical protein